jgi:predicted amidophosphoribosyltransferase
MEVKNIKKIRNKYVLLFDDVTTTNNSLLAGQELLKEAGAKAVQPFALGQTY